MEHFKKFLRIVVYLYPFFCLYSALTIENSENNVFIIISAVLGMFLGIGVGVMTTFFIAGLCIMLIGMFINWIFNKEIFD